MTNRTVPPVPRVPPPTGCPADDAAGTAGGADLPLGQALKIRSMVNVAGEFLPFMWPMRNFINHNPLYGLEHLPFAEAVEQARALFHARGYLCRTDYQQLLAQDFIDDDVLAGLVQEFLVEWRGERPMAADDGDLIDLEQVLLTLMTRMDQPSVGHAYPSTDAILALLRPAPGSDPGPGPRSGPRSEREAP